MTEPVYDWMEDVTRVYREVVAGGDHDEGVQRQEAFDAAAERLLEMTETGELKIPLEEAIRAALLDADRREGQRTDSVLRRLVAGQDALDLGEDDPVLEVVVTLGAGLRKQWRDITQADLRSMDQLRYRNYRQAADAYDEWRKLFDPTFEVLSRFDTFGDAVAAGAFK